MQGSDNKPRVCTIEGMRILETNFVQGVVGETAIMYDGTPHVAFIGRSNVGKSSTLNAITGKRKLVKVGQTPGKTKEINFFKARVKVDEATEKELYLVDLPGYGYAKLSKQKRNELRKLIFWYLEHPQADTALICMIIDAKVGLTDHDKEVLELINKTSKPVLIAINKVDKLNQKERHRLTQSLKTEIGDSIPYVLYSASTNKHVNILLESITNSIF